MGSYYEHKRTESVKLPYSFKCEHCMNDSGLMWATVTGSGTKDSHFKEVSEKSEEKMRKAAHKDLVRVIKRLQKDIVQKQEYTEIFTYECPHCGKPQSWGISIVKAEMFAGPLVFFLFGIFMGVGAFFTQEKGDSWRIPVSVGLMAAGAIAAVVFLAWNINKVNKEKKIMDMAVQKNLPVIQWEAVQYLLDEQ